MTREEAIICLKGIKQYGRDTFTRQSQGDWEESLDMAIKALEQEPCDDAISRQAAIKIIEREEFQGDALFEIEHLSPVIPQPKAGQWGICEDTDGIRGVYSIPNIKVTTVTPLSQPCKAKSEDTISRQAVLDMMQMRMSGKELYKAVYDLPSVIPQPKTGHWIPVSERLPEDRREVLVTAYWHETYQVMMASYFGDGLWWCVPYNNCGEHMQRLKPKAWMPLPEPYKAESEVENDKI